MKLKKGYTIIPQNEKYLICFNNEPLEKPLTISKIGAFLWSLLSEEDLSTSQLLEALLKQYEISTVLALGEIDIFLKTVKENEILE